MEPKRTFKLVCIIEVAAESEAEARRMAADLESFLLHETPCVELSISSSVAPSVSINEGIEQDLADETVGEADRYGFDEDTVEDEEAALAGLRAELAKLEIVFEAQGGRGIDLAERIDELRRRLGDKEVDDEENIC